MDSIHVVFIFTKMSHVRCPVGRLITISDKTSPKSRGRAKNNMSLDKTIYGHLK